jgi:parvulin-like peptidyl-prolyl isomerase
LQSSFGLHLVRVTDRAAATMPVLAELRPVVLREWQAEQNRQQSDAFYASLRSKYDVRLEGASAAAAKP